MEETSEVLAEILEAAIKNKTGRKEKEESLENDEGNIFWIKVDGEKKPATLNLVPGNQVYKEKLVKVKDEEFRIWDPFRSKLAAAIMNGLEILPIVRKSKVLYLGVSTGTTASHVSDIVGPSGIVFCVEHSSRVARDFLDRVAAHRSNIVPILQDARNPKQYFSVYGIVDVVYVDIAQPDQTEIAILNCKTFLKKGGYLMLVIKTRSIDVIKDPAQVIKSEIKKLSPDFEVIQEINLYPYDKDHAIVLAKY
jgi:fibrillarin-like pre-rRNA processing protein